MRTDAPGQRRLPVKVAHATQVAFALFTHIAQKENRRGHPGLRLCERVRDGQHTSHSGKLSQAPGT